jgi:phosphoglycerate dehydrogenase-like enzyme
MKVVATGLIWPEGIAELEASCDVEYDPDLWQRPEELRRRAESADAIVVRNQTRVDGGLLGGPSLKAVGRLGVGLDNVDLVVARERGVPVVYARNANAVSVAEYVIAAILHASRDLAGASADVGAGGWNRRRFTGSEVYGKTLGVVGVGEISRRVARRASAFGMRAMGFDPYVAPFDYPTVELGIELVDLETLLSASDFVSLHVPLTDGTPGLLSMETFRKMKPGSSTPPAAACWTRSRPARTTRCSGTSAPCSPLTSPGSRRRRRPTPRSWWPQRS